MAQLYAKSCLDQNLRSLDEWKQDAFTQFGEMVGDEADTFPCVPGRQGFFSIICVMDLSVIRGEKRP